MILPDDVDEKAEFRAGETDSEESDGESDGETVIGQSHDRITRKKPTNSAIITDSKSTARRRGGNSILGRRLRGSRTKRRVLGNGLLAVRNTY